MDDGYIETYELDDIKIIRYKKDFLDIYKLIRFIDIKHDFYSNNNEKDRSILDKSFVDNIINNSHVLKSKWSNKIIKQTSKFNELYNGTNNPDKLKRLLENDIQHNTNININTKDNELNLIYKGIKNTNIENSGLIENIKINIDEIINKNERNNILKYFKSNNIVVDTTQLGNLLDGSNKISYLSDKLDSSSSKNRFTTKDEKVFYEFPLYIDNEKLIGILFFYDEENKIKYRFIKKNYKVNYNNYSIDSIDYKLGDIEFSVNKLSSFINEKYNNKKTKNINKTINNYELIKYTEFITNLNNFIRLDKEKKVDIRLDKEKEVDILLNLKTIGDQSRIFDTYYLNTIIGDVGLLTIDTYLFNYALLTKSINVYLNRKERINETDRRIKLKVYHKGSNESTIDYSNTYNRYIEEKEKLNSEYYNYIRSSSNEKIDILYSYLVSNKITVNNHLFLFILFKMFYYLDLINILKKINTVENFINEEVMFFFKDINIEEFNNLLELLIRLEGTVEYDSNINYRILKISNIETLNNENIINEIKSLYPNYKKDLKVLYNTINYYKKYKDYPIIKENFIGKELEEVIYNYLITNNNKLIINRTIKALYLDYYNYYIDYSFNKLLYVYTDEKKSDIILENYINREKIDIEKQIKNYKSYTDYDYIKDYSSLLTVNSELICNKYKEINIEKSHNEEVFNNYKKLCEDKKEKNNINIGDEKIKKITFEGKQYIIDDNIPLIDLFEDSEEDEYEEKIYEEKLFRLNIEEYIEKNRSKIPIINLDEEEIIISPNKENYLINIINKIKRNYNRLKELLSIFSGGFKVKIANEKTIKELLRGFKVKIANEKTIKYLINEYLTDEEIEEYIKDNEIEIEKINIDELLYIINNNTNKYFNDKYSLLKDYVKGRLKINERDKEIILCYISILIGFNNLVNSINYFDELLNINSELNSIYNKIFNNKIKPTEFQKKINEKIRKYLLKTESEIVETPGTKRPGTLVSTLELSPEEIKKILQLITHATPGTKRARKAVPANGGKRKTIKKSVNKKVNKTIKKTNKKLNNKTIKKSVNKKVNKTIRKRNKKLNN